MALKDNRGGREYDKFAALSDGSTAIQVSTFSGGGADAVTSTHPAASSQTWAGTELCIVPKTTIEGRQGNFFVRNQSARVMTFKMYTSSKETPSDTAENGAVTTTFAKADGDWDQVGSDVSIAAGANKHIPWTNSYRHIAATITMAGGTTTDIDPADIEVYAI